jgi:hypothetical protein
LPYAETVPDFAEFIIGPAEGRTRWLNPGYTVPERVAWRRHQTHAILDFVPTVSQRKVQMRISAFVALMLGTIAAFAARPLAAAYNLPWCAQYADTSSVLSCAFTSLQQCMATVRGIGGFCRPNFRYALDPPDAERRPAKRHDSGYR